ncbi:hypothetical protein D3C73_1412870 [compost metagenome]
MLCAINTLQMLAQCGDLLATNFRRGFCMQGIIQLSRDLIGKLFQQAHDANAVLVHRQAEAQTKLGVIFKQRVCPGWPTAVCIGGIRCGGQVSAINR